MIEHLGTLKTGVEILLKILNFWRTKKPLPSPSNSEESREETTKNNAPRKNGSASSIDHPMTYAQKLGHRHRQIREEVLGLDPRNMATFYGLAQVTELENFEAGEHEFPQELIEQFCRTFQIRPDHMYEGAAEMFSQIGSGSYETYLKNGYEPYLYCEPPGHEGAYMLVYMCFSKRIRIGHRDLLLYVKSNDVGSFDSTGGGKLNICQLILAMRRSGINLWSRARIFSADSATTSRIREGSFYPREGHMPGYINVDYEDAFIRWFSEYDHIPSLVY